MKLHTLKPNSHTQVYQYEAVHRIFLLLTGKKKGRKNFKSTYIYARFPYLSAVKKDPLDHVEVSFHTKDTMRTVLF